MENEEKDKRKKIIIIILILLLCVAAFVGIIIAVNRSRSRDEGLGEQSETVESGAADDEETTDFDSEERTSEASASDEQSGGIVDAEAGESKGTSEEEEDVETSSNAGTSGGNSTGKNTGNNQSGTQSETGQTSGDNQSGTQKKTEPSTTESSGGNTTHQHTWEAQYETVHHNEEGHYESVLVQEAYDEPIYETHNFCNYCGIDITASGQSVGAHCTTCGPPMSEDNPFYEPGATMGSSYGTGRVQVGTKYHDAVYEQQWVVDKKAYDENVLTGYKCKTCGAIRN